MVRSYTDTELLTHVKSINGFKEIPKDYWLLAVRSKADEYNVFDDKVYLYKGEQFVTVSTCTTNPGGPILAGGWKKYTKTGAAVIKSDEWYYDVYKFGLHSGKMRALRQQKKMKYYRDADNDKLAEEVGKVEEAIYYTNFHFNNYSVFGKIKIALNNYIGNWSAGCVVCNQQEPYEKIINLTEKQAFVSLCLIKEF